MDRCIVHYDQDCFFVEVARRQNAALKGVPVAVGGSGNRAVVASCSYEARRFGVYSGMSMKFARTLCREMKVVKCDFEEISRISQEVTEIIAGRVPLFEKVGPDEYYVDMSGMDKHFGCAKFSHELREKIIRETHLPISLGLSVNKTVSKIATGQAKPCNELSVPLGTERHFLAPLPIHKIPGLGHAKSSQLRTMGIERIADLQELPAELLEKTFGKPGSAIWQKANGIDDSPIVPYREPKSLGHERTFDEDTIDMEMLRKTLMTMIADIGYNLRQDGKITNTVVVKIRYSDLDFQEKTVKIPYTNLDKPLTSATLDTFEKLFARRVLIRLVGVRVTNLIYGSPAIDLFDTNTEQVVISNAVDSIKKRFGTNLIKIAAAL